MKKIAYSLAVLCSTALPSGADTMGDWCIEPKESGISHNNAISEYEIIDQDDEAFKDGKFSKPSSVKEEENITRDSWKKVFSPSSQMQNVYDSFSYMMSVGRKTTNIEVDAYLENHYKKLGYELANDGINDYAFKTENGKTQVVSLWSLNDAEGQRSSKFYKNFINHLRKKFEDVSLHMPVQQQNEMKLMGVKLIDNRGHWTYLNVSLSKKKHVARLIDSTYWTAKLYDTKPLQDILGGAKFETPELRGDQGIFNHNDCGRFMLTYINANTSGSGKPEGSQIKRAFKSLKDEGFGLDKKADESTNKGWFSGVTKAASSISRFWK